MADDRDVFMAEWGKVKNSELKKALRMRKLPVSGNKKELLQRLEDYFIGLPTLGDMQPKDSELTADSKKKHLVTACIKRGCSYNSQWSKAELYASFSGVPLVCIIPPEECDKAWQLRAHLISRGMRPYLCSKIQSRCQQQ